MAKKTVANQREYIIPLRREYLKVTKHTRTPKAIKAVKQFIAKHMRVQDRDLRKVKLDKYLNEELWFRGIKHPPNKIKVKVEREGELVRVYLVEYSEKAKFKKAREEKIKQTQEKKKKEVKEEKKEEKSAEEMKEEKEKETSVAQAREEQAKQQAKMQKHTKKEVSPKTQHRKALKK